LFILSIQLINTQPFNNVPWWGATEIIYSSSSIFSIFQRTIFDLSLFFEKNGLIGSFGKYSLKSCSAWSV
jgi:hypothetical protein